MTGAPAQRIHAFDHLKAWAIVAVVFTHAGPDTFEGSGPLGIWLVTKTWTAFHVPSFLFVSGYLYARPRALAVETIARRLGRLLLPYLVASILAFLLVVHPVSLRVAAIKLLTGSAFGVYYYVFLFTICLLVMGPLSQLQRGGALGLWVVYTLYSVAASIEPALRPSREIFWVLRNPVQIYSFGFFLSGWLAALWRPELERTAHRLPALLPVASIGFALLGAGMESGLLPFALQGLNRAVYTFGVIGVFVWLASSRPAGAVTRFLSEATLGIYLYHIFFLTWLEPAVVGWSTWPRLGALVAAGLAGGLGVVWIARRLLGAERARRWVGA